MAGYLRSLSIVLLALFYLATSLGTVMVHVRYLCALSGPESVQTAEKSPGGRTNRVWTTARRHMPLVKGIFVSLPIPGRTHFMDDRRQRALTPCGDCPFLLSSSYFFLRSDRAPSRSWQAGINPYVFFLKSPGRQMRCHDLP
jgi:hypothetical protein